MHKYLMSLLLLALLPALPARAAPQPLDDAELADVAGRDGIGIAFDLNWNVSNAANGGRLVAGFQVNGVGSYAVLDGIGGGMTVVALSIDMRQRADGSGDYIDIGLPGFVGFTRFGYRAMGAVSDPGQAITAANSLGGLQLNGHAAISGHVYLWAQ